MVKSFFFIISFVILMPYSAQGAINWDPFSQSFTVEGISQAGGPPYRVSALDAENLARKNALEVIERQFKSCHTSSGSPLYTLQPQWHSSVLSKNSEIYPNGLWKILLFGKIFQIASVVTSLETLSLQKKPVVFTAQNKLALQPDECGLIPLYNHNKRVAQVLLIPLTTQPDTSYTSLSVETSKKYLSIPDFVNTSNVYQAYSYSSAN